MVGHWLLNGLSDRVGLRFSGDTQMRKSKGLEFTVDQAIREGRDLISLIKNKD